MTTKRRVNLADMIDGEPLDEPTDAGPRHPDMHVPLDQIAENPGNPRGLINLEDEEFQELATSVQSEGVITPITVCTVDAFLRHHPEHREVMAGRLYVVIAGHRRIAAARLAKLARIPAVVNNGGAKDPLMWAVAENALRVDLNPLQQARALRVLTDPPPAGSGLSQARVAAGIGKTQGFVSQRIALLRLVPDLQERVDAGLLGVKEARAFWKLPADEQLEAYRRSVREDGGYYPVMDAAGPEADLEASAGDGYAAVYPSAPSGGEEPSSSSPPVHGVLKPAVPAGLEQAAPAVSPRSAVPGAGPIPRPDPGVVPWSDVEALAGLIRSRVRPEQRARLAKLIAD